MLSTLNHHFARFLGLVLLSFIICRTGYAQDNQDAKVRILVDSIHAHNELQPPTELNAYSYHTVYGYRRAFDYLRGQNVQVDEVSSGRLDDKTLANYRMLFINLVSADLPPFLVSEIQAIKRYLEGGGSLLLITDHSNCYYHAYKLWPLLDELDIKITTETACDRPPNTLGTGNGWIAVTRFKEHPVTQNLRALGFQSGGPTDDRFAIATTSEQGWGDQWQSNAYGENDTPGLFGNWRQDEGERSGPLGVVAAKQIGQGRIAIVADQNIFGDPFLNYADNYRLWLNSVAWLTGEARLADPQPYRKQQKRVLAYEEYSRAAFGNSSAGGYYNLFAALGRNLSIFANADLSVEAEAILFAHDNYALSDEAVANLVRHLRAVRNILVLGVDTTRAENTPGVLSRLKTALGEPEIERIGAGENAAISYSWFETGQVLVLPPNQSFQNMVMPPPERRPNPQQQHILDTLLQLLDAAMTPE